MDSAAAKVTAPSGTQWTIDRAGHRAVVVEVGGGLRAYGVDGVDVVDGYAEPELCPGAAGQILAPWPNRIRDGRYTFDGHGYQLGLTEPSRHNAMHGLVRWSRWRTAANDDGAGDGAITVEHELVPQPGYPWPLLLRPTWTVGADEAFGWWQVFTSDTQPAPRQRRSVAVEPMTCPPDAFRSGRDVVSLEPGETWRGRWGISPRLS